MVNTIWYRLILQEKEFDLSKCGLPVYKMCQISRKTSYFKEKPLFIKKNLLSSRIISLYQGKLLFINNNLLVSRKTTLHIFSYDIYGSFLFEIWHFLYTGDVNGLLVRWIGFGFTFELNVIWSCWQSSFCFGAKWCSVWFKN